MDDIPFDRTLNLAPDEVDEPMPGLRRVMADNPGPFTFKGTISYIIGRGRVAIVDPGPDDPRHVAALLDAVRGEAVTHIFVTHTHRDHSPAVPAIKAATGAPVYAEGPHRASRPLRGDEAPQAADYDLRPDVALADGAVVAGEGWTVGAVTTPGHTANHMAFALKDKNVLLSGDHVMGWSTSIVAPPDGSIRDYVASLHKLKKRSEAVYFPGHGPAIKDPARYVDHLILHRKAREDSIVQRLAQGPADIPAIVSASYAGLDPRLVRAASLTVLAHLEDLVGCGVVVSEGPPTLEGIFRLSG